LGKVPLEINTGPIGGRKFSIGGTKKSKFAGFSKSLKLGKKNIGFSLMKKMRNMKSLKKIRK